MSSWSNTLNTFREQFKGYDVRVIPSCISPNREGEYILQAMEAAIGKHPSPFVTIDHEQKVVIYKR